MKNSGLRNEARPAAAVTAAIKAAQWLQPSAAIRIGSGAM